MLKKNVLMAALLICLLLLLVSCANEADQSDDTPTETQPAVVEQQTTTEDSPLKQTSSGAYTHPTGQFSFTPFGTAYEESDNLTFFYGQKDLVIAYALGGEISLNEDNLSQMTHDLLDQLLVQTGYADTYEAYVDEAETVNDGFLVYFEHTSSDYNEGVGEILIKSVGPTAGLILLTDDYDRVSDDWWAAVDSFNFTDSPDGAVADASSSRQTVSNIAPSDSADAMVADSGFRPEIHGFSFYNYGNDEISKNLTPTELQRLFGDQVCSNTANGTCTLTPPASQWMKQMNNYMDGGHCEGMAVLSSLLYHDQFDDITPDKFGVSQATDLRLGNEALQREIAYWWTTQTLYPGANKTIDDSPQVVLDALIEAFKQGQSASEIWAMGIYKSDFTGGHAITPFAVEDEGNGIFHILVYDNNFPGETRAVEVDTHTNTWRYQASINPDAPEELYDGDASSRNLEIVAIYPRLKQQDCPFCQVETQGSIGSRLAAPVTEFYEIWLEGDADLLIIDDNDKRIGFDNGQFVNEIEGAETLNVRFDGVNVWTGTKEPVYRVPVGTAFEIVIDGARLSDPGVSDVSIIGPAFFVAVEEIWLDPDDADSIFVEIDDTRHHVTYATDYTESPQIVFGVETTEADYAFLVQATELTGSEDTFDVAIDLTAGDFIIDTSFNDDDSTYEAYVLRIDDDGEVVFGGPDLVLEPDTTLYLNYLEWIDDGTVMFADFDYNGDGEIDESIELVDEEDFTFFEEGE